MVKNPNAFINLLESRKYKILDRHEDDRENCVTHHLQGVSKESRRDVKFTMLLRKQFSPSKYADNWMWLEFKKSFRQEGWLYGKANFIAFETRESFVIVSRKKLLQFVNASGKIRYDQPYVKEAKYAKYKILRDKNGRESTQINVRDLKKLEGTQMWSK
ncbi:hypothetical protein CMO96_00820 [Candidatus Woesebacteria bacterium]|nr:hypothetical protein [Candidatus Woesebacteria bacterium]